MASSLQTVSHNRLLYMYNLPTTVHPINQQITWLYLNLNPNHREIIMKIPENPQYTLPNPTQKLTNHQIHLGV